MKNILPPPKTGTVPPPKTGTGKRFSHPLKPAHQQCRKPAHLSISRGGGRHASSLPSFPNLELIFAVRKKFAARMGL
jgi:hypothetical protein